jgi:type IV pilus assembly protein PilW
MAASTSKAFSRQTGFGLVEILVGLAIGLIATLVIVQVNSTFEGQKRSTSGNADAQTNGSIALYTIQRAVQNAGFGLPAFSAINQPLKCSPSPTVDHDGDASTPNIGIFPVTITDGGAAAGASDSIIIRSGLATSTGGTPIAISGVAGTALNVANNLGCAIGDVAIITNGTNCAMTKVIAPMAATTQVTLESAAGAANGATLACMRGWSETQYQVFNNNLMENVASSVAGIVNIQMQYGISAADNDNQVTAWVDASGATWGPVAINTSVANRNRIKAVRIAVVARNGLLEKENVTNVCSSLTAASPTGLCAWAGSATSPAPAIDLSNDANWRRYRYRVFEATIPLRNMIWSREYLS